MWTRLATPDDWSAIWPIWHQVVAAGDTYTFAPDTSEPDARALWLRPPPAEVWVAGPAGGRLAGTALLQPNQPGLGAHVANAAFMVDPAAAGQGVGRALAECVLARARERGYLAMQFNAVVSTNTRAIGLWHSLGFRVIGTVPEAFRHPREGLVDLHIMHSPLTGR